MWWLELRSQSSCLWVRGWDIFVDDSGVVCSLHLLPSFIMWEAGHTLTRLLKVLWSGDFVGPPAIYRFFFLNFNYYWNVYPVFIRIYLLPFICTNWTVFAYFVAVQFGANKSSVSVCSSALIWFISNKEIQFPLWQLGHCDVCVLLFKLYDL